MPDRDPSRDLAPEPDPNLEVTAAEAPGKEGENGEAREARPGLGEFQLKMQPTVRISRICLNLGLLIPLCLMLASKGSFGIFGGVVCFFLFGGLAAQPLFSPYLGTESRARFLEDRVGMNHDFLQRWRVCAIFSFGTAALVTLWISMVPDMPLAAWVSVPLCLLAGSLYLALVQEGPSWIVEDLQDENVLEAASEHVSPWDSAPYS